MRERTKEERRRIDTPRTAPERGIRRPSVVQKDPDEALCPAQLRRGLVPQYGGTEGATGGLVRQGRATVGQRRQGGLQQIRKDCST